MRRVRVRALGFAVEPACSLVASVPVVDFAAGLDLAAADVVFAAGFLTAGFLAALVFLVAGFLAAAEFFSAGFFLSLRWTGP